MRRAKIIILWSLGALLLTTAAAVVFLATAGDDFYRWAMRQVIEGKLDRKIRADGHFSFDVGMEPTLIVTDVWIENAPWSNKKEMARAKRVEVQIALRPLFSGIVRIPRLVVKGLDLDLETSPDGQSNWVGASSEDDDAAAREGQVYPLLEFVSLQDIDVTYRDRQSGRDTEILLDYLHSKQLARDASFKIRGAGSFNRRTFQVTGRFGSIEQALAATVPYPLELMLQSSNLVVDLTGTVQNLLTAEGFDMSLIVRTPSIDEVLRTLEIDAPLFGRAEASARLRGNLESLAVEDIDLEVIGRSGQELHAEGWLADIINGTGLDLRFAGTLGPETLRSVGDLPPGLAGVLDGITRVDLIGRMIGDLEALVVNDLQASLEHGSGAHLWLQGHAALDFSEQGPGLAGFEATTLLSLPDRALLERALGTPLPNLGAIYATADLDWAGDWITLRGAEAELKALGQLQLNAEGRIGKLSGKDFAFELDPRINLTAAVNHARPLVYLFEALAIEAERTTDSSLDPSGPLAQTRATGTGDDLILPIQRRLRLAGSDPGLPDGIMGPRTRAAIEDYQARHGLTVDGRATEDLLRHLQLVSDVARGPGSPEPQATPSRVSELAASLPALGPASAAVRLSHQDGVYRFDDLTLRLGTKDALRVDITGTLGALRPARGAALEEIALAVSFAVPSSLTFSQMLPPEVPEFRMVRGRFDVQGTTEALSILNARMTAEGPDGLVATATGQAAKLSLATGFTTQDLALDLDARWPDTESVYRLFDLNLPELGPVWARATLRERGETFNLTGINVTAGSPEQPAARVTGEIGDLLALRQIELTGEFNVATAALLGTETVAQDAGLGKVHGRFDLSNTDGSIGLEALSAEIEDTKLLSLSIKGLFDDIARIDDLRMEAALTVPNLSRLGREFGFDAEPLGRLSFKGEVSGSEGRFRAKGKARLGKTDLTGTLSGTLTGERPALRAKLYSPLFHLADVGLVPLADALEPSPELASKSSAQEPAHRMVFDETPIPFEALKRFDLDLDVLFEDLTGVHLDIDKAEARLDVVDGVLTVDPLSFNFVGGRVDLTLRADARGESPKLMLGLVADDVVLSDFLSQTEVDVPLDGEVDLDVDLKATGRSARALASSLEGKFDLAIERGRVRTSLLRLATSNPVIWLLTESVREDYSDINCLILRFNLRDGVAESQTLLLDTPNIRALGKGRIDLRNEFIDIEVSPQAKTKRLMAMSTPFAIKGPLANPSMDVSTAGALVGQAGRVLVSPVNLLGSLLPLVGDSGKDDDNLCLALQDGLSRK